MKKILILLFVLVLLKIQTLVAQDSTSLSLDLLRAPSSPAFQILEVSDVKIERPTTSTDLLLSIKQSTKNFSIVPENYSLDVTPFWLFGGEETTYKDFSSDKNILKNIIQTLGISFATVTEKDTSKNEDFRKLAIGFKFSLFRGKISNEFATNQKELNKKLLMKWSDKMSSYKKNDIEYQMLSAEKKRFLYSDDTVKVKLYNHLLDLRLKELQKKYEDEKDKETKDIETKLEGIQLNRIGWKLDFACGLGLDFPTNDINLSYVNKYGFWLTGGYESDKNIVCLAVARLLFSPGQTTNNTDSMTTLGSFDYGSRLIIEGFKNFTFSGEILGRTFFKNNNTSSTETKFAYSLGLSYEIFKNKLVTFNIGKDFDKNIETGGNLVAALNLILGFGTERNVISKDEIK
ncbi:MAG: hypothetical protein ISS16_03285 [Ignavibacteria bacterium]|nr:hypothetical protein [Ignavibacteria bacterium]